MISTADSCDPALAAESDLTARAVGAGLGIGMVLTLGNLYMGLKTGWGVSGDITSAVLGFAILASRARRLGRPYSILENNITQTIAAMATMMPATLGLLGAIPGLDLLGRHYPIWMFAVWGLTLALFGILLALPLRQRYVVSEPLSFPSATATAEVIRAVHRSAGDAGSRLRALVAGAAVAALVTWFRDGRPAWVPASIWLPFQVAGYPAQAFTLGLSVSPCLVGVGTLAGVRTGLSLGLGAVITWGVLAPLLVKVGAAEADYGALVSWLLWPGVALMVSSSLVSLALKWKTFRYAFSGTGEPAAGREQRRLWIAPAALGAVLVILAWMLFGVHPPLGALVVLGSVVLIGVCVRSLGETDILPLGPLGQLVQLLVGLLAPGSAVANVTCGSVVAGAGASSGIAVSAFKAGSVLGAGARNQLYAQLLGAVGGALVALPAYAVVRSTQGLGNSDLPVPGALPWKALAELSANGLAALPPGSGIACAVAAALGVFLTLLEPTRVGRFLPAPFALAIATLVPAAVALAMTLGSLLWVWFRRRERLPASEEVLSTVAAGAIAGESLMAIGVAVLVALGAFGG